MLFVLAIAGQDRSRAGAQLSSNAVAKMTDADEVEAERAVRTARSGRSPASAARTLDIEPVVNGF